MKKKLQLLTFLFVGFIASTANAHLDDWATEIEQLVSKCQLEVEISKLKNKKDQPTLVDTLTLSFDSPVFFRVWSNALGGFGSYGMVDASAESTNFDGGVLSVSMNVYLPIYADKEETRPYTLYGYITLGPSPLGWKDGVKYKNASWVKKLPYEGVQLLYRYDTVNKELYFSEMNPSIYPKPIHAEVSPDGTYFKVKGKSLSDSCNVRAYK